MKPREKAIELMDKFYNYVNCWSDDGNTDYDKAFENAKQCALIAVDMKYAGIINVIVDLKGRRSIDEKTFLKALNDINGEWIELKSEIEKL